MKRRYTSWARLVYLPGQSKHIGVRWVVFMPIYVHSHQNSRQKIQKTFEIR